MLRSLIEKFKSAMLYAPQTFSATTATSSMDLQGLSNFAFEVVVGAFSTFDGTNNVSLTVQESDDNSSWADAPDESLYALDPAAASGSGIAKILDAAGDASSVHLIPYRGNKRYARLNMVEAGTVSCGISVTGISTKPQVMPPA